MATAHRRVHIANPAGQRRRRRNMSAKQIRFFGTPQQKAALKRSRAAKRSQSHRKRTRPLAKRKNFGEIVSLSLGAANPARKRKAKTAMAHTKRRARRANRARSTTPRRRRRTAVVPHRRRSNPVARRVRRHRGNPVTHHRRRSYRRNPLGAAWGSTFTEGLAILSGLLGSKYVAQMVLGSSNTGFMGYIANLAVGGVGGWAAGSILKKPKLGQSFFVGSVIEVIIRVLEDYTPAGTFISSMGVGDYFASNWVTPQRYTDALNGANVQIPNGWAPVTQVISSSGASAGAAGLMDGM